MLLAPSTSFESVSAIFNLEIQAINGHSATGQELLEAIETDVANYMPISKTAVFKHFTGNRNLSKKELDKIVTILQQGIVRCMEVSPESALSYAHAVIICACEAGRLDQM